MYAIACSMPSLLLVGLVHGTSNALRGVVIQLVGFTGQTSRMGPTNGKIRNPVGHGEFYGKYVTFINGP